MTDFLDVKRREITDRLKELKPAVDEYSRLKDAASALAKVGGSAPAAPAPAAPAAPAAAAAGAKKPGRPPGRPKKVGRPKKGGRPKKVGRPAGSATKAATAAPTAKRHRAGRPKGSGTRAAQALSLVQGQAGITIPELAAKMNIKQSYLYRVLPGLEQDGKISKKGRGWHPKKA